MDAPRTVALDCPSCGKSVASEDMELSLMLAKCSACDTVFSFAEQVGRSEDEVLERVGTDVPALRPATPVDHRVRETVTATGLTLELSWFQPQTLFLAGFALFWNGFLVVWYSMAFAGLASGEVASVAMLVFPLLHVAVGIGVGYTAVAGFVNKTVVDVGARVLTVRHGPLPWPGNTEVRSHDLDQLFLGMRVERGKNSSRTVYDLKALLKSGRELVVCKGLTDARSARYLEHRVEGWLGLEDRPVAGEHLG